MTRNATPPADPSQPPPSALFSNHLDALRGPVVDLACGRGRHAIAAARAGLLTVAIDRNPNFLAEIGERAQRESLPLRPVRFDLETGVSPPLRAGSCGAVLVFRYLHRPLAPAIARLLMPGGVLLYETFTTGQRELGSGPRNPAFLLEPNELPGLFPGLEVLAYDEGRLGDAVTARLLARAPA